MIYTNYQSIECSKRTFEFGDIYQVAFGYKGRDKSSKGIFTAMTCPKDTKLTYGANANFSMGVTKSGKKRIIEPKDKKDDNVSFIIISDPAFSTVKKKELKHDDLIITVSDMSAVEAEVIGHTEYEYTIISNHVSSVRTGMYDVVLVTVSKDCIIGLASKANNYEDEYVVNTANCTITEATESDLMTKNDSGEDTPIELHKIYPFTCPTLYD